MVAASVKSCVGLTKHGSLRDLPQTVVRSKKKPKNTFIFIVVVVSSEQVKLVILQSQTDATVL